MGWYVHLHVAFSCSKNEGVASLAAKHRPALDLDDCREACWFLDDLALRTGANLGPKGGLSLWGLVGNYSCATRFAETLRPFWADLLTDNYEGGPCDHARVVIFEEQEQRERASAVEVFWDDPTSLTRQIVIRRHDNLPFCWMQY